MRITDTARTKETRGVTYRAGRPETASQIGVIPPTAQEEGATVALSAEGLGLAQKKQEEQAADRESVEKQMYQEMLENAKEASKAQEEGFGDMAKALEIARRILDGDIVPLQDEQFLMEFNSEIYMKVKSMARLKEDPKEYDTLMEEEEEGDNKKKDSTAGDALERVATQAEAAQAGGGEAADSAEA